MDQQNKLMSQWTNNINRLIRQPAYDEATRIRLRWSMIWSIVAFVLVSFMTILSLAIKLWLLVLFGSVILLAYGILYLGSWYLRNLELTAFVFCFFITLWAFVFILILGGIPYSHGLVFVGLNAAFSSVLTNRTPWSISLFSFYCLTIIAAGLAQPILSLPQDYKPWTNVLYYVLNIIWLSGSILFFIINYFNEKNQTEEKEKNRLIEIDTLKTKLYTNITHEFRTPLTIIQGLSEEIGEHIDPKIGNSGRMILRNSHKLLRLINKMLALSKLESGTEKLQNVRSDIVSHVKYLVESFHSAAQSREIELDFRSEAIEFTMDFDPDKLEDVLINLISNAVKFTPRHGHVLVQMEVSDEINSSHSQSMIIRVHDSGPGIPDAKLDRIYDRFYQVEETSLHHSEGSGLGLTIAYEYVQLMKGEISVKSEQNTGTKFTITLPVTRIAPLADVLKLKTTLKTIDQASTIPVIGAKDAPLLLIVEDNEDVIAFLQKLLENDYRIISGENGLQGYQLAREEIPDIIISDVMMPEMDGFTFLKKIKTDILTSHIPVIMLTARVDMNSRIKGLETGADAYLEKPFNKQELLVRLRKMLELREQMRRQYEGLNIPQKNVLKNLSKEDEFILQVRSILEEHISDKNFQLELLYKEMAMSRSQFYRKFSALTNMGIKKYLRKLRLNKARKLLQSGKGNVSTIAQEVGIPNISYFSRIFSEEFGVSPSKIEG
jgi:signal transduction histidine kinase/DNA-binding response OmpR family regulator